MIIDFHTHAFPDRLAGRAMRKLLAETDEVKAWLDGRVSSLLASMDGAGIDRAVLCSIATKPEQFDRILEWSRAAASDRIVPFPSVHPLDPAAAARVARVGAEGFKGLKLHPYYQDFSIDDEALTPFYESAVAAGLILVCHTGFDVAFPRVRRADPERIRKVVRRFPGLKLVTTHLGAWGDWQEVQSRLAGEAVYMEISFCLDYLPMEQARALILAHPADYVLFGTDSPWQGQEQTLTWLRSMDLGAERERKILGGNALRLLGDG